MSFGATPSTPKVAQPPQKSDEQVQQLAEEERRRYYSQFGGRATAALTGGLGSNPGFGSAAKLLSGTI